MRPVGIIHILFTLTVQEDVLFEDDFDADLGAVLSLYNHPEIFPE